MAFVMRDPLHKHLRVEGRGRCCRHCISSRRLRASIIKGRVVSVAEMAVPASEQGISNHIPPINRLSVWWKTVGGADFLKGRNREQLAALRRDFNPVTAILKQIDDAIVRKLQDTLL